MADEQLQKGTVTGELVYITGGFDWDANYRLIISPDEKSGTIVSQAILKNETNLSFSAAKLELVEGELKRVQNGSRLRDQHFRAAKKSPVTTDASQSDALTFSQDLLGDYVFIQFQNRFLFQPESLFQLRLYPNRVDHFFPSLPLRKLTNGSTEKGLCPWNFHLRITKPADSAYLYQPACSRSF